MIKAKPTEDNFESLRTLANALYQIKREPSELNIKLLSEELVRINDDWD